MGNRNPNLQSMGPQAYEYKVVVDHVEKLPHILLMIHNSR